LRVEVSSRNGAKSRQLEAKSDQSEYTDLAASWKSTLHDALHTHVQLYSKAACGEASLAPSYQ
jgi:hypothetical protein